MKIRQCFVSNSSSLSFIAFAQLKDYQAVLEQLNEEERKFIEDLHKDRMFEKWGMKLVSSSIMETEEDYWCNGQNIYAKPDFNEHHIEVLEKYISLLEQQDIFSWGT